MLGKDTRLNTTALLVFFLWLVVFEKLVNNRLVDLSDKCDFFSYFQYGFIRSSLSTADLLQGFNRSGATRAVVLDISKTFDRVWHAGLLHKFKSYGVLGEIFGLISSFLSNRRLQVVHDGKNIQLMLELLKAPFFVLHFSYYIGWAKKNMPKIRSLITKIKAKF